MKAAGVLLMKKIAANPGLLLDPTFLTVAGVGVTAYLVYEAVTKK